MKLFRRAICTLLVAPALSFQVSAETLEAVLARMDKAAPSIHALGADVQMVTYTAVIQDQTTETGTLQMQKLKPDDVRAVIAFKGADEERTIALLGKYVEIYYPKLKSYHRYDLGTQAQTANQLLLLGFGTSGSDLAKSYDIRLVGSEKIGSQTTSELELVPKDPKVKEKVAKVDLWIPQDAGYPVQQQFFDPPSVGNWRKVTYTQINLQPSIKGNLDLKLPKDAKPAE